MTSLRQRLLRNELDKIKLENPEETNSIEDFAFDKLKKQASEEIKDNLARILYRAKYNLPPNDPRFLDLTDEEILYDLILQNEYQKWTKDRGIDSDSTDNREKFESDEKQFKSITKQLENGEDIDLHSLLPDKSWEKV